MRFEREDLEALHAEPVRNNPPKLVGYLHRPTMTVFTPKSLPSQPTVPTVLGTQRINRAHAFRMQAAMRNELAVGANVEAAA